MKIRPEHYTVMRDKIAALPADRVENIRRTIRADAHVKDAQKRFRWDLAYAGGLDPFICGTVYQYADDTHVDTALRAIVHELEVKL